MRSYEPAFAHHYGLSPDAMRELTYGQWRRYRRYVDDMYKSGG